MAVSADIAKGWFEGWTPLKPRSDFKAKGKLCDKGYGCVYVYYSVDRKHTKENALYVGQTGEPSKHASTMSPRRIIKNPGGKAGHICVLSISKTRIIARF